MARLPTAGKTLAVVLALVLAGVATFAIFTYVRGLEQRAFEDAELVEVFVAQDVIPAGTSAEVASEAGLVIRDSRPRATVPDGSITGLEQISGLVAAERILANEVLLRDRWEDPSQVASILEIPQGLEALSVQVGIPAGVAGFVRAGDRVSLIVNVEEPAETVTEDDGTIVEEPGEVRTQYLIQGIEVLAVGQRVVTEEGEGGVQESTAEVLMTVALEPADAERMAFAIQNASLYFTLLPEDAEPADTPGRTLTDLFE